MEITISDEEVLSVNRAILLRYGIDFTNYEITSLKRRVARIISKYNLNGTLGLWRQMLKDSDFIFTYIDEITVGLTEMFRNPDLWIKLRDDILPQLISNPSKEIWHAGCSTGEEIYTTSIVLHELGMRTITKTIATDINRGFLTAAQKGTYDRSLITQYQKNYQTYNPKNTKGISLYFELIEEQMNILPAIRQNITFQEHNLIKPLPNAKQKFDIIFCRNVMIYFDDKLKETVLQHLHQTLKPSGLLILGYFDALSITMYQPYFEMIEPAYKILRKK